MKDWEKNDLHTLSDPFPSSQVKDPANADPGDPLPVKGAANLSHPIGF